MDSCLNVTGDASKLFDAIGKASKKFQPLPKNKPGQYGNQKFDYAPYNVIRKCILNHLHDEGVTFIQPLHSEGTSCAVTLIVSGHGSMIMTTLKFEMNSKPQDFGKESTYYRRYQLQSFFCLEGDKDADDLEDPVVPPKEEPVKESPKADDKPKSGPHQIKPSNQSGNSNLPVAPQSKESKAVAQLLMEAMQQLKWTMFDMDLFCKEHIEHFPGYVSPTKLDNAGKATLHALLVKHKDAVPF